MPPSDAPSTRSEADRCTCPRPRTARRWSTATGATTRAGFCCWTTRTRTSLAGPSWRSRARARRLDAEVRRDTLYHTRAYGAGIVRGEAGSGDGLCWSHVANRATNCSRMPHSAGMQTQTSPVIACSRVHCLYTCTFRIARVRFFLSVSTTKTKTAIPNHGSSVGTPCVPSDRVIE